MPTKTPTVPEYATALAARATALLTELSSPGALTPAPETIRTIALDEFISTDDRLTLFAYSYQLEAARPAWSSGEPPRDGQFYAARGAIFEHDESGANSTPFLAYVRWSSTPGGFSGWLDDTGLALCSNIDARITIYAWSPRP